MAGPPEPKLVDLFDQSLAYPYACFEVKETHTAKIPAKSARKSSGNRYDIMSDIAMDVALLTTARIQVSAYSFVKP